MTVLIKAGTTSLEIPAGCRSGEPVAIGPRAARGMAAARWTFIRLLDPDRTQFIYGSPAAWAGAQVTMPAGGKPRSTPGFEFRGTWPAGSAALPPTIGLAGILFARALQLRRPGTHGRR